jgi:hypothetical protein
MRDKLMPWLPAIFCGVLSLITVGADVVGRFLTGTANVGLTAFLCFLPICFFHVGVILKNLRDENLMLRRRFDEILLQDDDRTRAS